MSGGERIECSAVRSPSDTNLLQRADMNFTSKLEDPNEPGSSVVSGMKKSINPIISRIITFEIAIISCFVHPRKKTFALKKIIILYLIFTQKYWFLI